MNFWISVAVGFGTVEAGFWILDRVIDRFPFVQVLVDLAVRLLLGAVVVVLLAAGLVAAGAFGPANAHVARQALGTHVSWRSFGGTALGMVADRVWRYGVALVLWPILALRKRFARAG